MYGDGNFKQLRWLRWVLAVTVIVSVRWLTTFALGQYSAFQPPGPTPIQRGPQSYADFFNEQVRNYQPPPTNAQDYIINRYFYHSPTLSPYLNLTRRGSTDALINYYRYVRPEIARRQQQSTSTGRTARSVAPSSPMASMPAVSSGHLPQQNPYFNQFYNFGPAPGPGQVAPKPLPKLLP
jgi:hypothetical protein